MAEAPTGVSLGLFVDIKYSLHDAFDNQVGNTGGINTEATTNMMQTFWDSAMQLGPADDEEDSRR